MPVQQSRPPMMIGGSGVKTTLQLVTQYADGC
jgi:alkanesulfonate monooxygenase SsuD/methylene tetrahydromethanopterin reductase-like flavin-dependent oxidoreductase (luciferase family)